MAGKQKFKYTGTLAKPIIGRSQAGLLVDELAHKQAENIRIADESAAKLPELFKVHGVPEFNYMGLVIAMAREHVPGFNVVNPAGRKTLWGDYDKAAFRLSVDDMQAANPGMPTTQAISKVCRLASWEEKTKGMKVSALRKHYDAADSRFIALMKDAKAYESMAPEN